MTYMTCMTYAHLLCICPGQWKEGKCDSQGIYTWADGRAYDGGWREDLQHGQGLYTAADGATYDGK